VLWRLFANHLKLAVFRTVSKWVGLSGYNFVLGD
jgi:hypothetical protein